MTFINKEKVFAYLVDLRDSGVTNMWAASPYIARKFRVSDKQAGELLVEWIKSFRREEQ